MTSREKQKVDYVLPVVVKGDSPLSQCPYLAVALNFQLSPM